MRSGLPWLAGATLIAVIGLAGFLAQVAVTESQALELSVAAAVLRSAAIFLVCAHVAASTLREINDKGLELMLALPLRRSTHYLGRLAGFALCAVALSAAFCAPLFWWARPSLVACWGASLACEAVLAAAVTLFFAMTLAQLVPAMAATLGLYVLGRSIATMQAIASGPLSDPTFAAKVEQHSVDALAAVLPRLDQVTRAEWLLYGAPPAGAYVAALTGLVVFGALVTLAGLIDFHRRSV
ncbi:MAG: ABC transporter permease [Betaproteobacteria bacterium]|nr:ABC transporter permease [Betaproteobacteria bacterium]